MFIAGIDEAGRGPVIGDMFIALVVIERNIEGYLYEIGVKDSKTLSPAKRAELFPKILKLSKLIVIERCSPELIDRENLNQIFIRAASKLISIAEKRLKRNIDILYIDVAGSRNKTIQYIKARGFGGNIIAEHHADTKYIVVSAASIIAKYLRDRYINYLKSIYGDFGSGYPSDSKTIRWLSNWIKYHKELPPIVRKSWLTVRKLRTKTLLNYLRGD